MNARYVIQRTDPESGKRGCWIFQGKDGETHREGQKLSPVFSDAAELYQWMAENQWAIGPLPGEFAADPRSCHTTTAMRYWLAAENAYTLGDRSWQPCDQEFYDYCLGVLPPIMVGSRVGFGYSFGVPESWKDDREGCPLYLFLCDYPSFACRIATREEAFDSCQKEKRIHHGYHIYFGVVIWRNTEPGYKLRWSALGGFAADTLAGIQSLIREELNKPNARPICRPSSSVS